jgi:hypothetical protein
LSNGNQRPIVLRRQNRPAPAHGPSYAPRPPAAPPAPAAKSAVAKPAEKVKSSLPCSGGELPVTALQAADVPPGKLVRLGILVRAVHERTGRPMFQLHVPCSCKKHTHRYAWRGDWPLDASVRSHQASRCKGKDPGGVWLGLDPEQMEVSQQAFQEGREAFEAWKTWWSKLSPAERSAISAGRAAANPPATSSETKP